MDILDLLHVGKRKELHGKEWIILSSLGYGMYLAVRSNTKFPATVKLIRDDEEAAKYKELEGRE